MVTRHVWVVLFQPSRACLRNPLRALLNGWYPLDKAEMSKIELQSKLTLLDATNLVVGAIIGADIYVASSFGAGYLGPSSLLVWVVAGIIAIVIAAAEGRPATDDS